MAKFDNRGLDQLGRELKKMQQNAQRLSGKQNASFDKLLPNRSC